VDAFTATSLAGVEQLANGEDASRLYIKRVIESLSGLTPFNETLFYEGTISRVPNLPAPGFESSIARFANPSYGGRRLDWCFNWGAQCGRKTADVFCNINGYPRSTSWIKENNVGARGIETYVVGDARVCSGSPCDAYKEIACQFQ
jgi:hypothetical protein